MSDKLAQEKELLREIASRPPVPRALGYIKLTGPGLLQSAMTLGAGSAAASVVAGASFGYKLLWVQPVAMFLGVMMFIAVSKIVLTRSNDRPYWGFMREMNNVCQPFIILVFLWAFASIFASVIWHFPQYGLAAGAIRSVVQQFNPAAEILNADNSYTALGYQISFFTAAVILLVNITVVFNYGRGGIGIRIYEWFLRCMIALVFLTFLLVVIMNFGKINWIELGKGVIGWYGIPYNEDPAEYANTVTMVLGMIGAAVGINMTFLYPYSLLKKGWGEEHKTLAKWDLGMTMFLPFVLITSLIMIAMTVSGVYDGTDIVQVAITPLAAAASLTSGGFLDQKWATVIFCGGLVGMSCGAISAHMTCCGFTWCEMLGLKQTTWKFRLFALTPSIGVFGVVFQLPFWFPIAASAICLTMLPIAYFLFFMMSNNRHYLGNAVGKGLWHWIFNLILIVALIAATTGAIIKLKSGVYDKVFPPSVQQPMDK